MVGIVVLKPNGAMEKTVALSAQHWLRQNTP